MSTGFATRVAYYISSAAEAGVMSTLLTGYAALNSHSAFCKVLNVLLCPLTPAVSLPSAVVRMCLNLFLNRINPQQFICKDGNPKNQAVTQFVIGTMNGSQMPPPLPSMFDEFPLKSPSGEQRWLNVMNCVRDSEVHMCAYQEWGGERQFPRHLNHIERLFGDPVTIVFGAGLSVAISSMMGLSSRCAVHDTEWTSLPRASFGPQRVVNKGMLTTCFDIWWTQGHEHSEKQVQICFGTVHLTPTEDDEVARWRQLEQVVTKFREFLLRREGNHAILAGDFNMDDPVKAMRECSGAEGLTIEEADPDNDSNTWFSHDTRVDPRRLDHIILLHPQGEASLRNSFDIKVEVRATGGTGWCRDTSDHKLVTATLARLDKGLFNVGQLSNPSPDQESSALLDDGIAKIEGEGSAPSC